MYRACGVFVFKNILICSVWFCTLHLPCRAAVPQTQDWSNTNVWAKKSDFDYFDVLCGSGVCVCVCRRVKGCFHNWDEPCNINITSRCHVGASHWVKASFATMGGSVTLCGHARARARTHLVCRNWLTDSWQTTPRRRHCTCLSVMKTGMCALWAAARSWRRRAKMLNRQRESRAPFPKKSCRVELC